MCYLFHKTFLKMAHSTETQRKEILILIGCGDKTKTGGISSYRVAYCQQSGGWQFEHLIPSF
jgi:hypothetical protein